MVTGPDALARFLRTRRERKGMSLRSVEDETGISNAYLSQLENGKIRQPSPVILHKLSDLYGAPYAEIMRLAGYPMPGPSQTDESTEGHARFADVTPEEERALEEYLAFLRTRRARGSSR